MTREAVQPKPPGQTAFGGIVSVFAINSVTRVVLYLRHILITTYLGLSGHLDAFFTALAAAGLLVMIFGDIFDSIGVPRMVKARGDGEAGRFEIVAGNVVKTAMVISTVCTTMLLILAPWSHLIAPGFTTAQKALVVRYTYCLVPMALVYLPYHAIGSVLRSQRRFADFYLAEFIAAIVTLAIILCRHDDVVYIPLAWSAGYMGGFVYLLLRGRSSIRWGRFTRNEDAKPLLVDFLHLIPVYLIAQAYTITDKVFGSYLGEGAISALYYALLLMTTLPSLLSVENVFVTPLAEAADRSDLMTRILSGVFVLYVPIAMFTFFYGERIIAALFERGMFGKSSVEVTAVALRYYVVALPPLTYWGILVRYHQVAGRLRELVFVSLAGFLGHVVLNYLFAFYLGWEIKGIAVGTALNVYFTALVGAFSAGRAHLKVDVRLVLENGCVALGVSGVAIFLLGLLPDLPGRIFPLLLHGMLYVAAVSAVLFLWPGKSMEPLMKEVRWNVRNLTGRGRR